MIADLIFAGLFVWLHFVVFDDTDQKEVDRKEKIDAITGVSRNDKHDPNT